ncbi:MAG: hypothetical protein K5872_13385 [Rhizobiaceae bacterium]|nr:hypothetical protein [Rhizobiaceae bacterium]MCV0407213.1 hypothetical protein [Rhizobiaceae bacterium]
MRDQDPASGMQLHPLQTAHEQHGDTPSPTPPEVANIPKRRRVKSVYRDAKFRPWFQAVAALEQVQASGGTSVTWVTPAHPHFEIIRLTGPSHTSATSIPPAITESLSDEEEERAARFWRSYASTTPRQHRTPASWRVLSDEASLEWFHYAMCRDGDVSAFTLHFNDSIREQLAAVPSSAGWLGDRLSRRLKEALGRPVALWFAFDVAQDLPHVHGELQADTNELKAVRKAMRLAGGEWHDVRQHQAHTRPDPTAIWSFYAATDAIFIRPLKGPFAHLPRPINGDWVFATKGVRRGAGELYSLQRQKVLAQIMISKR